MYLENYESNGSEEIGFVTPIPECLVWLYLIRYKSGLIPSILFHFPHCTSIHIIKTSVEWGVGGVHGGLRPGKVVEDSLSAFVTVCDSSEAEVLR